MTELAEDSAKGKPIVVEGKKDAETLRELGAAGDVLTLKTGGQIFLEAITEIEASGAGEVILLLDFDSRGREARNGCSVIWSGLKLKVNVRFGMDWEALVGREIQSIESLTNYLKTLHKER